MTPSARLQAAIEMLDEIIIAARDNGASADNIAKKFFKTRRYAGSKDRRAIREHVYAAIRRFGNRPETGRGAMVGMISDQPELAQLFDGTDYGPHPLSDDELKADGNAVPDWLIEKFAEPINEAERDALFDRAPLDIRLNPKRGSNASLTEWPEAKALALPHAFRLPTGTSIENSKPFNEGKIEIQDFGSQVIVAACLPTNPQTVLDLCAGAGGKTLGLAGQLPDDARIVAADTDRRRLNRIAPRVRRSRTRNIETLLLSPNRETDALQPFLEKCDLVVVDAPCSGTGTWRRNPELRWRMTPERLAKTVQLQQRLLHIGAEMVAPGGRLVYAVCSLLDDEGGGQTDDFLKSNSGWKHIEVDLPIGRTYRRGTLLSPYHDGTDGFYFTCLEKL